MRDDGGALIADPTALAWRCEGSLFCCQAFEVSVSPLERTRIRARVDTGWPEQTVGPDARALPKREDGTCTFIEQGLCGYRVRFGVQTQPRPCRTFPYISLRTPTQRLLGLDFSCPTAARMLAAATTVEAVDYGSTELPSPFVRDLAGQDALNHAGWAARAALFEAYQRAKGAPLARLAAAAAEVAAIPTATAGGPIVWSAPHLPGALVPPLLARSVDPLDAAALFDPTEPMAPLDHPPQVNDPEGLFNRYLAHRILAPGFLRRPPTPERLVDGVAAAAVRFHVERARGATPLAAIRLTELWLLHRPHLVDVDQMGAMTLLPLLPPRVNGVAPRPELAPEIMAAARGASPDSGDEPDTP